MLGNNLGTKTLRRDLGANRRLLLGLLPVCPLSDRNDEKGVVTRQELFLTTLLRATFDASIAASEALWLANCYFAHNYSGFSRLAAFTSPKPLEAPKSTAVSQCFRPFHMSFISRVLLILARDSPHLSLGPGIPERAAVIPAAARSRQTFLSPRLQGCGSHGSRRPPSRIPVGKDRRVKDGKS